MARLMRAFDQSRAVSGIARDRSGSSIRMVAILVCSLKEDMNSAHLVAKFWYRELTVTKFLGPSNVGMTLGTLV